MDIDTPVDPNTIWALTLAFLRFGIDTRAARHLKELAADRAGPDLEVVNLMLDALAVPRSDRARVVRDARTRAEQALQRAAHAGLAARPWYHDHYPALLREIVDPPIVLWHAGTVEWQARPAVAIVGSRRASPAGLTVARRLARDLAKAGAAIVSGLARGIDAAAHEGALDAGGSTVAVLGCGGDIIYPAEHRRLAERVRAAGALLTEFPPGMQPRPHHFPLRNRIISGLCRAVIVIEASDRSGSLITARAALEQGREVLAVPGNVASGHYAGSHALIKDGAALVETVGDVLNALGWETRPEPAPTEGDNPSGISRLESVMAAGEPYSVDELAARSGLAGAQLLAELGALEVAGIVARVPGASFVRVDKSAIGEGNG